MVDKYVDWNRATIEMLRQHQDRVFALDSMRDEYAALRRDIGDVGAVDYAKPRVSGSPGDPQDAVVDMLHRQAVLKKRIDETVAELECYQKAWAALTADEQHILHEFFQCGHRPAQRAVEILCAEYGYEQASIYRKRTAALRRFKALLVV